MSSISLRRRAAGCVVAILLLPGLAVSPVHASCSMVDPSHGAWSAILTRWVENGQVDYAGLKREGQPALTAYLATLSGACGADYERWTRHERLAFWINAYNAFTVRLILDHYPIASIQKIGWLPNAAFRERFIPMEGLKGATISLDDIEHRTLRSDFGEPRIHFALVCAARSCPVLRGEAYRGTDLDAQLDDQARRFLADTSKNRVDAERRVLHLSSIFRWFRDDFESTGVSLASYVGRYVGQDVGAFTVEFLDYDWSLNDRAQKDHPDEDHRDADGTRAAVLAFGPVFRLFSAPDAPPAESRIEACAGLSGQALIDCEQRQAK